MARNKWGQDSGRLFEIPSIFPLNSIVCPYADIFVIGIILPYVCSYPGDPGISKPNSQFEIACFSKPANFFFNSSKYFF